jgi:hypothetical protein
VVAVGLEGHVSLRLGVEDFGHLNLPVGAIVAIRHATAYREISFEF